MANILDYKRLSSECIAASRLERKRYSVKREYRRARCQQLGRCGEDLRAASRIGWPAGRSAGRSVGRSGSLTRTVADPSVDYSGDLTWTWKQVLGIRFSILHTTLINAARLLHRIGTYAAYGEPSALDARLRSHALPRYSLRYNVRCLFDWQRPFLARSACWNVFRADFINVLFFSSDVINMLLISIRFQIKKQKKESVLSAYVIGVDWCRWWKSSFSVK